MTGNLGIKGTGNPGKNAAETQGEKGGTQDKRVNPGGKGVRTQGRCGNAGEKKQGTKTIQNTEYFVSYRYGALIASVYLHINSREIKWMDRLQR